jgi:hypothetical protein
VSNSSQQKGFFAAQAPPCKPGRTTGCNYFALLRALLPRLLQKLAMPLQPHCPPSFCPLSPETGLLTEKDFFN